MPRDALGDIAAALHQPIRHERVSTESVNYLSPETGEFYYERIQPALEAYDEKENRNAVVYMVAYNMMAARQDEFGEAFYPTVVVGNDQVGYTVSIRLIEISNDIRRPISGDASNNFNRRNIVQAVIYPDLLRNDITKVIPVVRDDSAKYFVDPALVAPYSVLLTDGSASNTAPLAIGRKFSLINISQTESTLDSGLMDISDALDTNVVLDAVYVEFTTGGTGGGASEVVKFRTSAMQRATFNFAVQGYYREMNLQFDSETLLVGPNTVLADGGQSTILAPIVSQGYEARIGMDVFGKVVLETGDISLNASTVRLNSIRDTSDNALDLTTGTGQTLAALFDGASVIGYDIDARRTNSNRRQRGKLLNTNFFSQVYTVPLHAPITIPRPMQVGDVNDSSDLAALITATRIMTSNDAVDAIFRLRDLLAETTSALNTTPVPNNPLDTPAILGVSSFHYPAGVHVPRAAGRHEPRFAERPPACGRRPGGAGQRDPRHGVHALCAVRLQGRGGCACGRCRAGADGDDRDGSVYRAISDDHGRPAHDGHRVRHEGCLDTQRAHVGQDRAVVWRLLVRDGWRAQSAALRQHGMEAGDDGGASDGAQRRAIQGAHCAALLPAHQQPRGTGHDRCLWHHRRGDLEGVGEHAYGAVNCGSPLSQYPVPGLAPVSAMWLERALFPSAFPFIGQAGRLPLCRSICPSI